MPEPIDLIHLLEVERIPVQFLGLEAHRFLGRGIVLSVEIDARSYKPIPLRGQYLIYCESTYDFSIRPPDPNLLMGGPNLRLANEDLRLRRLFEPWCQLEISLDPTTLIQPHPDWETLLAELKAAHELFIHGYFLPPRFFCSDDQSPSRVREQPRKSLSVNGPYSLIQNFAATLKKRGYSSKIEVLFPHMQVKPHSDGEIYDPPRKFRMLHLDQSYVIAEKFSLVKPLRDEDQAHS